MIRIRNDLQATSIYSPEGVLYYDVRDPSTQRVFRLYDIEWELAEQLTQEQSLAGLQAWTQKRFGYTPTSTDLAVFFQHLRSFGWENKETPVAPVAIPSFAPSPSEQKTLLSIQEKGSASYTTPPISTPPPAPQNGNVHASSTVAAATDSSVVVSELTREKQVPVQNALSVTSGVVPTTHTFPATTVIVQESVDSLVSTSQAIPQKSGDVTESRPWVAFILLCALFAGIVFLLFLLFGSNLS